MISRRVPTWFFLLLALGYAVVARSFPLRAGEALDKRYVTDFSAPTNYRFSWGVDDNRCSFGTTSGQYISRSQIVGATSITQKEVNACASMCDRTLKCGFFHPIHMRGGDEGNVICALYTAKQSKTAATYSAGTSQSGGSVLASYGFTRSSPVSRIASGTTSRTAIAAGSTAPVRVASVSSSAKPETPVRASTTRSTTARFTTTSTTARSTPASSRRSTSSRFITSSTTTSRRTTSRASSSTSSLPRLTSSASRSTAPSSASSIRTSAAATSSSHMPIIPSGASLVQFQGCASSPHTIPMLVSRNYPNDSTASSASTVWVVQHGSSRNFDDYFSSVHSIVGDAGVVIAPNFYATSDSPAPNSWYQPSRNLAWSSNSWATGDDAVSPSGISDCSSFDVYDTLIASLRDRSRYPNLQRIIVVAHSAGSAMMGRYGMLSPDAGIKYVLANAPALPYFTSARPDSPSGCSRYNSWSYGWADSLPRYAAMRNPGAAQAFRTWVSRDVTLMTGTLDTASRAASSSDQSCSVQAQGGENRRDRGYAFWAYINLLAGTGTDVSAYYGYDALRSQVTSVSAPTFRVRHCVVDGVTHDNNNMFASACGRAAINGASSLPAGPGPIRPP